MKVSIILPTYNRAKLIGRAIQSVLTQSFQDWELIIIDDASTDETPRILDEWKKKDSRIKIIRNNVNSYPDISGTLNKGIKQASGKYIARLDDDDYWISSEKLEKQVQFLESHPDYVLVGTGVIIVDANGKELFRYLKKERDVDIRKGALFANPFSHTTVMFRTNIFRGVGGYGNWEFAEDWELWLKLGTKGKLYNLPEHSVAYLLAGQNKSFIHQRKQAKTILKFISKYKRKYPRFLLAYLLNASIYIYSFLPWWLKKKLHPALSKIKRSSF
ncbi:MAG: glycosyltransferase family 2 protein [Candidatus Nealsonbacteria bacterium CG10_big_fil_rev_8_21_14_0_10_36_24]|uniref:Glycosyltransferase family 2 protein n=1 Tax=Candidatus Nealsonbacteria bacterium CG10_big_fil_rev_8_21_14_0_10_36_24 TaxID=1974710 RepID=A0A2M6NSJ2_9BACT|nr:MAG: glycosyltransferase family 2 protein [Candidatus Nealsonbacteria bacterium CG10_big_fil_rev_8_21_14_0_10_36_24]